MSTPTGPDIASLPGSRRALVLGAVLVGLVVAGVESIGIGAPSYWSDEVASLRASGLSLRRLFAFVTTYRDSVHGLYYAFLHEWVERVGHGEFATRLPSSLGTGLAAAGLYVIVRRYADARLGVAAVVAYALFPRVVDLAAETRSYALSTAVVVWLTLLLLLAVERASVALWAVYALVLVLAAYLFLFSVLVLAAHLVAILVLSRRRIRDLAFWVCAVVLAGLATLPLVIVSAGQKTGQLAWMATHTRALNQPYTAWQSPLFLGDWTVGIAVWVVLLLLVLMVCLGRVPIARRPLLILGAAWYVLPTLALIVGDLVAGPLYSPRYLIGTAPGLGILLALAVSTLAGRKRLWPVLRVAVALALVTILVLADLPLRGPYAKNGGSDLREVAAVIGEHARPGDGFLMPDQYPGRKHLRQAADAYPQDFRGLVDLAYRAPFTRQNSFTDVLRSASELDRSRFRGVRRVWLALPDPDDVTVNALARKLQRYNYVLTEWYRLHRDTVYAFTRTVPLDQPRPPKHLPRDRLPGAHVPRAEDDARR